MNIIIKSVTCKLYTEKIDITTVSDHSPVYIDGLQEISGKLTFSTSGNLSKYINKKGKIKDKFYVDIMKGKIEIQKI